MGVFLADLGWLHVIIFSGIINHWPTLHVIRFGIRRVFLAHVSVKRRDKVLYYIWGMQGWILNILLTNHHRVSLIVVKSEQMMLLSSEILSRGVSYLPKSSDLYTKTNCPYLYYQTPMLLTSGGIVTSPKYSKTWHKILCSEDLDTGV